MRRTLSAIFVVLSILTALAAFGVPVNTSWTYQGQLQRSGSAYTGSCDFQFSLWTSAIGGAQQGSTQSINGVNVANGLFTVTLDFGDLVFAGEARWLGTSVQCSGDGGFTPLDPRQPITAAPYALSLRPGALIISNESDPPLRLVMSGPGDSSAISALNTGTGDGVNAGSALGNGVVGSTSFGNAAGVFGISSGSGAGIYGGSENGTGVFGRSYNGPAIYGENTSGNSYAGQFNGPVLMTGGQLTVSNQGSTGLNVTGNDVGVRASATAADSGVGVWGSTSTGVAIFGESFGIGSAIYGQANSGGFAGRFAGSVLVEGNMIVTGNLTKSSGTFKIDHPLDPANKFLSHSFVESPDMKNIYDGNVTTDATGSATVTLPDYFATLNRDYRYQLTVLGQFAQAIVSREIAGNSFEIHTDKPGVKVSWQVTGIRQDAYAQANPIVVEESKPVEEQGLYLYPAGFGASEEKQIGYPSRPATPQTEQKTTKKTK